MTLAQSLFLMPDVPAVPMRAKQILEDRCIPSRPFEIRHGRGAPNLRLASSKARLRSGGAPSARPMMTIQNLAFWTFRTPLVNLLNIQNRFCLGVLYSFGQLDERSTPFLFWVFHTPLGNLLNLQFRFSFGRSATTPLVNLMPIQHLFWGVPCSFSQFDEHSDSFGKLDEHSIPLFCGVPYFFG